MTGILLGRTFESPGTIGFGSTVRPPEPAHDLFYEGDAGLVTVAGTGAGKGVSHVVPTALSWPGSLIAIDVKGELAEVAAIRRQALGQKVAVIDPFHATRFGPLGHGMNPLDLIDPASPTAIDDALSLADQFRGPRGGSIDPFWEDRARDIVAGTILFVAAYAEGEQRTLALVRRIWSGGEATMAPALAGMKASSLFGGYLGEVAEQFLCMPDKTRGSVLTTMNNQLECLLSPMASKALGDRRMTPQRITEDAPFSIFLVLPPERLASHGRLLRLWLGTALVAVARRRRAPAAPTLVLADEAAQLGRMNLLTQAASLMRGYGLKLWSFWQSLGQMEALYGEHTATFLDNAGVLAAFGVANGANAARISAATGWEGPLLSLPPELQVLAMRGETPRLARRISYLEDPRFAGLYAANPFAEPRREAAER